MIQFFCQTGWACFNLFSSIAIPGMIPQSHYTFCSHDCNKISFHFIFDSCLHKRRHFSSVWNLLAKMTNSFGVYWLESLTFSHFHTLHFMKSVRIQSFSGPYFPAFGLNTEWYSVSLRIRCKYGEIRSRKTPNTDTFHAVLRCHFCRLTDSRPSGIYDTFILSLDHQFERLCDFVSGVPSHQFVTLASLVAKVFCK